MEIAHLNCSSYINLVLDWNCERWTNCRYQFFTSDVLWTLFFLVHNGSPEVHYITRQSCRDLVFNKESLALLVCPLLYTEATVHSRTAYSRQAPRLRRQPLLHSSSLSAPKLYASALGYNNFNLAARTSPFSIDTAPLLRAEQNTVKPHIQDSTPGTQSLQDLKLCY